MTENRQFNEIELSAAEQAIADKFSATLPDNRRKAVMASLSYVRAYCLKYPEWDEITASYKVLQSAFAYYYLRKQFLAEVPFTEKKFFQFTLLQKAIADLKLDAHATFEMVVFVYILTQEQYKLSIKQSYDEIARLDEFIEENRDITNLQLTVKAGKKNFKINNSSYIELLVHLCKNNPIHEFKLMEWEQCRMRERERQYLLIGTLLEHLPHATTGKGRYSNAQRRFALCVLHLCGMLLGDAEMVCTNSNNATFDNLMRSFKGVEIRLPDMLSAKNYESMAVDVKDMELRSFNRKEGMALMIMLYHMAAADGKLRLEELYFLDKVKKGLRFNDSLCELAQHGNLYSACLAVRMMDEGKRNVVLALVKSIADADSQMAPEEQFLYGTILQTIS